MALDLAGAQEQWLKLTVHNLRCKRNHRSRLICAKPKDRLPKQLTDSILSNLNRLGLFNLTCCASYSGVRPWQDLRARKRNFNASYLCWHRDDLILKFSRSRGCSSSSMRLGLIKREALITILIETKKLLNWNSLFLGNSQQPDLALAWWHHIDEQHFQK